MDNSIIIMRSQWDGAPESPLPVEEIWKKAVVSAGGISVEDYLDEHFPEEKANRDKNADFYFAKEGVIAELKEIKKDYLKNNNKIIRKYENMVKRLLLEHPLWEGKLPDKLDDYPSAFLAEFKRLFRPVIKKRLDDAKRQIEATKKSDKFDSNSDSLGVVIIVNEGFSSVAPLFLLQVIYDFLQNNCASIHCVIYQLVNQQLILSGSSEPAMFFNGVYKETAPDSLVDFVDELGRKFRKFIESKYGEFTSKIESEDQDILIGSRHAKLIDLPLVKR